MIRTAPLDGIRVLDLSRFVAGPLCAQLLGDMGAEVIKVERPGGEDARDQGARYKGESLYAMAYNRNKHGITLDTRHPRAPAILEGLVRASDVLVENFRPGTLADGPRPGPPSCPQPAASSGLCIVGVRGHTDGGRACRPDRPGDVRPDEPTGDPDGPPTLTGTYIADHLAGLYGAIGTLLALRARERTGEGQLVDVASLDALFSCLGTRPLEVATLGVAPRRMGSRDAFSAPANVFQASDGYLYIHGGTNALFPRLCAAIGRPDLAADPRSATCPVGWLWSTSSGQARPDVGRTVAETSRRRGRPASRSAPSRRSPTPWLRPRSWRADARRDRASELAPLVTGPPVKLSATPGAVRKARRWPARTTGYIARCSA